MTTLLQAAEQALDALDSLIFNKPYDGRFADTLIALRKTVEAAKQAEPTAWALWMPDELAPRLLFLTRQASESAEARWSEAYTGCRHVPLYAHPHQTPLDEAAMARAWSVAEGEHQATAVVKRRITRSIERAHGIGVPL
jgi:hypothetical protein